MHIKASYRSLLFSLLKIIVFVATLWYLNEKLVKSNEFRDILPFLNVLDDRSFMLLLLVTILMLLNWGIEAFKWKLLLIKYEPLSLIKAMKSVWSGITINNWIPNRVGEFAGRIIFIKKENQAKAVASSLLGSMAQFSCTIIFGFVAAFIFFKPDNIILWLILVSLITSFVMLLYFKSPEWHKIFKKISFLSWISKHSEVIEGYSITTLTAVIALSVLRYVVYVFQYYLLLVLFGLDLPLLFALCGISSIFLIQSFLPAITLTEVGIRGAVVLFVFSDPSFSVLGLLSAAYSLWLINIIVPTLAGLIFILSVKRKKEVSC